MKTFEYRLFVKKAQHTLLMQCLIESRGIYNEMLAMVKQQYEEHDTFPSKYDLEKAFKGQGKQVPATTVQMLADRLTKSLKRFLAAKEHNIPGIGFPRFKCRRLSTHCSGRPGYLSYGQEPPSRKIYYGR